MPSAPVFAPTGATIRLVASYAREPVISPDGTKVLYFDLNTNQVMLLNLVTNAVTLVSSLADGTPANGTSFSASFSGDGSKVVFTSQATNLAPGDSNGTVDIFVKDLVSGAVTRVSTGAGGTEGNGFSATAVLSADGTRVVFASGADNLVAGDSNLVSDVFVKTLATGAITRVSTSSSGVQGNHDSSYFGGISADNTRVVFASNASNLVAGDTNGAPDIFMKNLITGVTTRVSTGSAGQQVNLISGGVSMSADGTKVVFSGTPFNSVPGDMGFTSHIYLKDLVTGALTVVSTNAAGVDANAWADQPKLSADGTRVVFSSPADNLVAGDTNGLADVFVKDLVTGAVTLLPQNSAGVHGNYESLDPWLSNDGTHFVFTSNASNLTPEGNPTGISVYATTLNSYSKTGYVTEDLNATATGKLGFSDADTADSHTVSVVAASGVLGALTATICHDTTGTETGGEITWNYSVNNALLQGMKQGQTRIETFTLNLSDGGTTSSQTVTVTISGANDAPALTGPQASLPPGIWGTAYNIWAETLLAGFNDVDGDALSVVNLTANHGTVTDNHNGTFTITPTTGYTGPLTLNYGVSDGHTATAATRSFQVNAPLATFNGTAGTDYLYGTSAGDLLYGYGGQDYLDGNGGGDVMYGGAGDDAYFVDHAGDLVLEAPGEGTDLVYTDLTYTLPDFVENLWLTGTSNAAGTGNDWNNVLFGNDGNNSLWGLGGNDFLDGKAGGDTLFGGRGNDGYVVDNAGDTVIEDEVYGGTDVVYSSVSFALGYNLENLSLTGAGAIDGTGNDLGNVLFGNDAANKLKGLGGNDYIDGKGGADVMAGHTGDDGYVVDNSGDVVFEYANEGYDTVYASATFTLGDNVEKLSLQGAAAINGTGNGLANVLSGNAGNNTLRAYGADDYLQGGAGADRFVFEAAALNGHDVIGDFVSGVDKLVFSAAAYSPSAGYSETGLAVGSSAQFIFDPSTHLLFWDADGEGGAMEIILATLTGVSHLAWSDFAFV